MTGHRIIRNSDGSAYVVDHTGRHVKTHDSATEAKEHLEELREKHEESKKPEHEKKGKPHPSMKHEDKKRHPDGVSHDPYYHDQHKNR